MDIGFSESMEIGVSVLLLLNHIDPVVTVTTVKPPNLFCVLCPALASLRPKTLGNYFFDSPIEMSNNSIKDLKCFINDTKWFTRTDSS